MNFSAQLLLVFSMTLSCHLARAFPEMVRHGYTHCTACHTSINGGGLLNEYGRSLSGELLSQKVLFGKAVQEGDEKIFGLFDLPEGQLIGGDIRLLQTFVEDKASQRGRFIIMQVALEYSVQITSWFRSFVSVARMEPRKPEPSPSDFVTSPNHGFEFLLTHPESSQRATLKLGKFIPSYGIQFQEHTIATRKYFDFQPGQERVAAEFAWTNENYSVVATSILAQTNFNTNVAEKGGALQLTTSVGEKSKFGINYYQTDLRKILGLLSHISFSERVYGLLEVNQPIALNGDRGLVEVFKLGYEHQQGLHFVGIQEFANLNTENSNPKFEAFSVGSQWFPRPHWDFYGLYRKERNTVSGNDFNDQIWLIGHYYL